MEQRYLKSDDFEDGLQMYYSCTNAEYPIVYLHGYMGNQTVFQKQIQHFERLGYGTIAPDQRGHGKSTLFKHKKDYTLEHFTDDLEILIKKEATTPVTIVGHSMGTMVAQEYAARHPDKVASLVLLCGTAHISKAMGSDMLLSAGINASPIARAGARFWNLVNPNIKNYYPDFSSERYRNMDDFTYLMDMALNLPPAAVEAACAVSEELLSWNTEKSAAKISAPTLIIHGTKDQLVPDRCAHELHELIESSFEPTMLEGADHAVIFRKPQMVIDAMEPFIKEVYGC